MNCADIVANPQIQTLLSGIPGLQMAYLFGSRAQGQEHLRSDYDFAFLFSDVSKSEMVAQTAEILQESATIEHTLAERLIKMVGFRNVLVHGYQKLQFSFVYEALHTGKNDIGCFS